jgi:hypothetical protein
MAEQAIIDKIKWWYSGIIWKLFLRNVSLSDNQYWEQIYKQEKLYRETQQPSLSDDLPAKHTYYLRHFLEVVEAKEDKLAERGGGGFDTMQFLDFPASCSFSKENRINTGGFSIFRPVR